MFMTEGMISMLTKQDKVNADRAAAMMRQQESVLKNLQVIIDVCEKNKFLDNVTAEELQRLKSYCSDMSLTVATSNKLSQNLLEAYKKYLEGKEAADKETAVKTKTKKAGKKKAGKKNTEPEDDLSGFFDE